MDPAGSKSKFYTPFEDAKNQFEATWGRLFAVQGLKNPSKETVDIFSTFPVKAFYSFELISILNTMHPSEDVKRKLVIDPDLIWSFDRFVLLDILKSHGLGSISRLDKVKLEAADQNVVFLAKPTEKNICTLVKLIKLHQQGCLMPTGEKTYSVIFVPKSSSNLSSICNMAAIKSKNISSGSYPLNLVPLSEDVLQLPQVCMRTPFEELDIVALNHFAEALEHVQQIYGKIATIQTCGASARDVFQNFVSYSHPSAHVYPKSKFRRLTIIDRSLDPIAPFLTAWTFESLLKKFFKVKEQQVVLSYQEPPFRIDEDCFVYSRLRDAPYAACAPILKTILQELKNEEELLKLTQAGATDLKSVSAYKDAAQAFILRKRSVETYLKLVDLIKFRLSDPHFKHTHAIENEIIAKRNPTSTLACITTLIEEKQCFDEVLRLLCLYGEVFGLGEHLPRLQFQIQETYGFYATKVLERVQEKGFLKQIPALLPQIPTAKLSKLYGHCAEGIFSIYPHSHTCSLIAQIATQLKVAAPQDGFELVCIIGGVTPAEISACRLLSKKIAILTTGILDTHFLAED